MGRPAPTPAGPQQRRSNYVAPEAFMGNARRRVSGVAAQKGRVSVGACALGRALIPIEPNGTASRCVQATGPGRLHGTSRVNSAAVCCLSCRMGSPASLALAELGLGPHLAGSVGEDGRGG